MSRLIDKPSQISRQVMRQNQDIETYTNEVMNAKKKAKMVGDATKKIYETNKNFVVMKEQLKRLVQDKDGLIKELYD